MDLEVIENNLEMIESVISCKIVTNEEDLIDEIHIVSNNTRGAKQIARDIQSILIAKFEIPIDYKKISIAQIKDNMLKKSRQRLELVGLTNDRIGSKIAIKVSLSYNRQIYQNTLTGVNTSRNLDRLLVDATLKTVEDACNYDDTFIFEDIKTLNIYNERVVIVIVMSLLDGREHRLCGSSLSSNNYDIAVVKATLDAVNRFLTK